MGAAYGSDILYSESVEPENRVYNMEKIWEVILILVLAGMGFILQLDRKKEMEQIKQILKNKKYILEILLQLL